MSNNALAITGPADIERIAKTAAASGMCTVKRWEEAAYLLMTGYELGLSPMQSLRGIYVVNGKPVLSADLLVAVVRRSGLCESWRTIESTPDRCTITTLRRGETEPATKTWTMADAKRAGVTGKPIWAQYPAQMLRHRCASDLAREVYSDVVFGLYDPEEIGADDRASVSPIDASPAPLALPRDNGLAPSEAAATRAPAPLSDREHAAMLDMIARAPDAAELRASLAEIADDVRRGTEAQQTQLRDAAKARKAALTPPAPKPDGDEPPPEGPRGGKRARKTPAPADATGDAPTATDGASSGPQAVADWLRSEADTRAHIAGIGDVWHLEASARRHGRHLATATWGVRVYAARLEALDPSTRGAAERLVMAWAASGPKAQRRAA